MFSGRTFYVPPGPARLELRPLIEERGGEVVSTWRHGVENLGPEANARTRAYEYIRACVAAGRDVDFVREAAVVRKRPAPAECEAPAAAPSGVRAGRVPYSREEDHKILLMASRSALKPKGNKLWLEAERIGLCGSRPAQSMLNRYKKLVGEGVTLKDVAPLAVPPLAMEPVGDAPPPSVPSTAQTASPDSRKRRRLPVLHMPDTPEVPGVEEAAAEDKPSPGPPPTASDADTARARHAVESLVKGFGCTTDAAVRALVAASGSLSEARKALKATYAELL